MLKKLCILLLCFTAVGCKTQKEEMKWKKYEYPIYSIELPASWPAKRFEVQMDGSTIDDSKIHFNEVEGFRRWGLVRDSYNMYSNKAEKDDEKIKRRIGLYIESLESIIEGRPFTIEQAAKVHERFWRNDEAFVYAITKVFSSDNEIRYAFERELTLDVEEKRFGPTISYVLFKQDGGIVHRITVDAYKEHAEKNPEVKAIMERILNSFTSRQMPDSLINH